jgi:hypothetical protein
VGLVLLLPLMGMLLSLSSSTPALAQNQSTPLLLSAEAGFEGHVKDGTWVPIWITLENSGPELQGSLELSMGKDQDSYSYPVQMPTISRKQVVVYIFISGYSRNLDIRYLVKGKTSARVELTLTIHAATDQIYGVMSDTASAYNVLTQLQPAYGSVYVVEITPEHLPNRLHALQSLDALIVSGIDTGVLSLEQLNALSAWVAGGHWLVITGGADWQKTAAGFRNSHLLPIQPDQSISLLDLTAVQQFAVVEDPLEFEAGKLLAASGTLSSDAQIVIRENQLTDSLPLIIQRSHGLGSVIYLAFDPSQPPLRNWSGAEAFYQALFSSSMLLPFWSNGIQNWDNAASAAQTLPNLNLPSPWLVCGFLVIYLLVIGPLNFFILSRLKRRGWSWFTIPVTVVFCSAIVFLAGSFTRGSQAVLNQLAVVQTWSGVDYARVDGLLGLFSPSRTSYDVSVHSPSLLHPIKQNSSLSNTIYSILQDSSQVSIPEIRAEISSILPMAYESLIPAPEFASDLQVKINNQGVYLDGSLSNNSDLKLEDTVLLIPGSTIQIGSFSPGDNKKIHSPLTISQRAVDYQTQLPGLLPPVNPMVYTSYSFYPYDTTIDDMVGSSNYYSNRESYRRYMLVQSLVNYSYASLTRGYGIFLSGWNDLSPVSIDLSRENYKTQENTLYLISMPVNYLLEPGELRLTPGVFHWHLVEGQEYSYTPYNAYLYNSSVYSFSFQPIIPIEISEVKNLTVDMQASGMTGALKELNLYLYDFWNDGWVQITNAVWGSNQIENPSSYIALDGTIWLRIESTPSTNYGLQITRSDVTLVMEQK